MFAVRTLNLEVIELNVIQNLELQDDCVQQPCIGDGLNVSSDTSRLLADMLLYTIFTTRITNSVCVCVCIMDCQIVP